jgi:dTDP-4-amino-4,6-dideoxygalactose transaminase
MIPFSPPRIDKKIVDAVVETLYSGWITTGQRTKKFEQMLTVFGGHHSTLCVNSATSGLELMLRWFGVGEGDEVIVPAFTYAATANVVVHCGATPVLVDCGKDFNISVKAIENAITTKTKVIIPVDIAGFPCDYDEINQLVKRPDILKKFAPVSQEQKMLNRVLILSDAAHSLGAFYKGKRTGKLADLTIFSFHAVKNLTTAEGGAVSLNLPKPFDCQQVYSELCVKSLHGQSKDALTKIQAGSWKYDILEAGYKYNMTDIQASMGIVELGRYDSDMLVKRRRIFNLYSSLLSNYSWAQLPEYENADKLSSYHVYLLRITDITEMQRDEIIAGIFKREVAVNVHFVPLPMFSFYKSLGYKIEDYPVSYENYSREITLPVYYDLTDEQVHTVVKAVAASVGEVTGRIN